MKSGRWGIAIVLVLALGIGWFEGSPWWTLSEMRSAAKAGDSQSFASHVDFHALRKSVKHQLRDRLDAAASDHKDDGIGSLGAQLGAVLVGPIVDGLVTPEGVEAMFATRGEEQGAGGEPAGKHTLRLPKDATVEHQGLSRFRYGSPDGHGTSLIFTRHFLGWRLSGVELGQEDGGAAVGGVLP